jgi:UDP-N-acetyl-D-glucosamine dehydrogenase
MSATITVTPFLSARLRSKIEERTARIGIIGLGYVGLPLAILFSNERFRVTGFDIDPTKVRTLMDGESYIRRIPGSDIDAARQQGFTATCDYAGLAAMDAIIICVPTPLDAHHEPDISYITTTLESLAPNLRPGQLISLESTTYPGTTDEVMVSILEKHCPSGLRVARECEDGDDVFYIAFSPEREDPGNETIARRDIPKVVGGFSPVATELACALYGSIFNRTVPVSSPAVAEMTKLLENIYRCVNIALINELKLLCLRMGIDIWEVIEAAKTKPFGFQPFYPGPGLGGHCIPVDPFYLSWKAREWDFHTRFIELAGEINISMPYHVVSAVSNALNHRGIPIAGAQILILGVAYKKDVDDLRESPALTIIELLRNEGAKISYNDPYVPHIGRGRKYNLELSSVPLNELDRYECVLILTDHSDYDYRNIVSRSRLVIDTRNATRGITSEKIVRC